MKNFESPKQTCPGMEDDRMPPHPHLPVSPGFAPELDSKVRDRLDRLAQEILAEEPGIADRRYFDDWAACGIGPWPNLVIEDHSSISLHEFASPGSYGFRAMMLAGDGDLVVLPSARNAAFETYCRNTLGLGSPTILTPKAAALGEPPALSCARDPKALQHISAYASQYGGLNIVPYMGGGSVWTLARAIAQQSGVAVRVAAPMPQLTQRVNDKLWFSCIVTRVLGGGAEPEVAAAYSPSNLAYRVCMLLRSYQGLAVRVPDAASSFGSILVDASFVDGKPLRAVAKQLVAGLQSTGWSGRYPLMVTAWEAPIAASPSVQLWIPKASAGLPVVEAIFEQVLAGQIRTFSGAVPSDLPLPSRQRIALQATQLGYLFQRLGYYGRCSFDAILVGDDVMSSRIHWVDCNGRWGGVSIPMTLVKRLIKRAAMPNYLILDKRSQKAPPRSFDEISRELESELFVAGRRENGIVFLSPTLLEEGSGFMIVIIGDQTGTLYEEAEVLMQRLDMAA